MSTFWSLVASGAGLAATLLFGLTFLITGAFTSKPPQGADAMGLVVPLVGSGIAAFLLLVATWTLAAAGRLSWLGPHAGWIATAVAAGIGAAAFGIFLTWASRRGAWIAPAGIVLGGVAPLLAGVLIWRLAWREAAQVTLVPSPALTWPLLLAALGGLALAIWGGWIAHVDSGAAREHAHAEAERQRSESARRAALSPVERLREDYSKHSPNTPLWVYVAGLPEVTAAEEREYISARALQVPDFDTDLQQTLTTAHPRYRHGALVLLRQLGGARLKPTWASAVAGSIRTSAAEIRANPNWLVPDEFASPDPLGHLRLMHELAQRFGASADLESSLGELKAAIAALPPSPAREQALAELSR